MGIRYRHRLAVSLFCAIAAPIGALAKCAEDRVTIIGGFGRANFNVQVADDNAERSRGLMHVARLPTMSGMLFVYDQPRPVSFWMRNTLIPLDMLFASSDGIVQRIHENAMPLDESVIHGGENIQFVLEINGGLSARLGVKAGDALQHPEINDGANHPCE